ncbi:hypothetical protein NUW54_g8152 [Trametes sanguinea]|uniref:Uncharacterized protein n=1 Tax=Trametes sanguinea TaxID=158606 RepID=A0ACC1PH69_9APHY|nr:hypothetical protein NUW54_g8152 [Trametes sanguinea]
MFAFTDPEVFNVLALIEAVKLPHPSAALLACFVRDSVDPIAAALYVRDKLSAGEGHLLVSDWSYIVSSITENGLRPPAPDAAACSAISKREGGKCCITGKAGTLWDPLVVVPILPYPTGWLTDQDRIMEVLDAFFTSGYREWWLAVARHPECVSPYYNHWLFEVQPVLIGPGNPIKVEGRYALLGDHSRLGIEKVDARFVGTHARLCRSMQVVASIPEMSSTISYTTSSSMFKLPSHAPPSNTTTALSVASRPEEASDSYLRHAAQDRKAYVPTAGERLMHP